MILYWPNSLISFNTPVRLSRLFPFSFTEPIHPHGQKLNVISFWYHVSPSGESLPAKNCELLGFHVFEALGETLPGNAFAEENCGQQVCNSLPHSSWKQARPHVFCAPEATQCYQLSQDWPDTCPKISFLIPKILNPLPRHDLVPRTNKGVLRITHICSRDLQGS